MDFEVFSISGPVGSAELFGGTCSIDTFSVQSPESSLVPIICGENSNSHSNEWVKKTRIIFFSFVYFQFLSILVLKMMKHRWLALFLRSPEEQLDVG